MPPKSEGSPNRRTGLGGNIFAHPPWVGARKARRPPPPMTALAKQPSTRPNVSSVAFIASLTEAGSLTSQMRGSTLPGPAALVAAALLFFSALRPQIETLQPAAFNACAMPRPMPPLPPVMMATRPARAKMLIRVSFRVFPFRLARVMPWVRSRADALTQPWTSLPGKSNMGRDIKSDLPRNGIARKHKSRGNNAVQARHARYRWAGRGSQARPSGGHERGFDGHAGRPRRGARHHRREEVRSSLRRADRRGARVLYRRQSARSQQPEAGQEQRRRLARNRLPSVPAAVTQSALPARHRGQWSGRRRRDEFCADGRHDPVRALVIFFAGVPPYWPGAGLRIDLAAAAADRQGALGRAVADGRAAAGGKGAGMGARPPRL